MTYSATDMVSVVVPVYGCDSCLEALCERMDSVFTALKRAYELILVDDRSPDTSWLTIGRLQQRFPAIRGIRLSRNYGQQIAISAGLAHARGTSIVVMDCDLQDPPEVIPQMFERLAEGYDLVLARRTKQGHSAARRAGSQAYFRVLNYLTGQQNDSNYGSYSLLSRKVVDGFLQFQEKDRHYLFILRWLGFRMGEVEYVQPPRYAGCSSYSLRRLFQHAFDGLFFQSTVLLHWMIVAGLFTAFLGVVTAAYFIYQYFAQGSQPGWTSLIVILLLSTGSILTALGIIGQYIGKIFDQTKGRPLYVVDVLTEGKRDV